MKLPASFRTSKGMLGIGLVVAILLVAVIAPMLIPADWATKMDMRARLAPPTWAHPLGTDQLGRDLLFRVLLGAQTSSHRQRGGADVDRDRPAAGADLRAMPGARRTTC